ncbi:MAG TPA: glycosyltransferase [Acidimicrobiales bacterium]|nr:glycosyltransferase [Acidimicrobiales bacterium]
MNLAIVHDYLTQRGGAERVVLRLAGLFPDAPVFTSVYAADMTFPEFQQLKVVTSDLQGKIDPARFRLAAPRYPAAFRRFDLSAFDRVIVTTSGFAHHVRHGRALVYCHTPPRFLYDPATYLGSRALAAAAFPGLAWMRARDRRAAAGHESFATSSRVGVERIRAIYGRDARVIHPPLWTGHLPLEVCDPPEDPHALVVARLLPYKRIDVAIQACSIAGIPLTIVGTGPDEARLRRMAGNDARFLGRVPDDAMADVWARHSVVLAPGLEDFGYGPVEANFAGRPVLALRAGGALETVQDGVTGLLVEGENPGLWADALLRVHGRTWAPEALRAWTTRFSGPLFDAGIEAWLATT